MEKIMINPVRSASDLKAFTRLPYRIHKEHAMWVPPLRMDERRFFTRRRNPAFGKTDTLLLLAWCDDQPVGRIMGIINRERNIRLGKKHACFGYLECENDPAVASVLLRYVEQWALENGMNKIAGPLGFNDQDQKGFLIEGFEFEPSTQTVVNFPYLPALVQQSGYSREMDYVVYHIDLARPVPDVYRRIVGRLYARNTFELPDFTRKKEIRPWIKPSLQLMNETFAGLYGYDALTDREMHELARKFYPVLDPRFVKIALADKTLQAFIVGIPNLNRELRKAKGRIIPFVFYYLTRSLRKSRQFDLLIAGVKPEYRRLGVDVYGMLRIIDAAREAGYATLDSHLEHEPNRNVRNVMEKWGGRVVKRYRVYQKELR